MACRSSSSGRCGGRPGPTPATWAEAHNSPGAIVSGWSGRSPMARSAVGAARRPTSRLRTPRSLGTGASHPAVRRRDAGVPDLHGGRNRSVQRGCALRVQRGRRLPGDRIPDGTDKRFGTLIESLGRRPRRSSWSGRCTSMPTASRGRPAPSRWRRGFGESESVARPSSMRAWLRCGCYA